LAMLCVEPCDDHFDNNLRCWVLLVTTVGAPEEIVFVDDLTSGEPVGADGELDGFEDRGLAGVVVAKQDRGPGKAQIGQPNATEVFNVNASNAHGSPPEPRR